MYNGKTILGVIPARGGSKGLPRKNILSLAGKPLIAWTIEQANASTYLDKVIVNTDDQEIASVAKEYGAGVPFLRPSELAGDKTAMIDVLSHMVDFLRDSGTTFDYIALLEPTSPLRADNDINDAIKQLIDHELVADSLVSVGEVHLEHPSIMKQIIESYVKPYETEAKMVTRRQELGQVFFPYGVIYLARTDKLIERGTFYQERTIPYFIERWQNYEVDDIYDFICIEAVMNYRGKEMHR